VSVEESLESSMEQTLEQNVSEFDTSCESSYSSIDLEDLEENIYLKKELILALEGIKKLRSINIEVEVENKALNEQLMNL